MTPLEIEIKTLKESLEHQKNTNLYQRKEKELILALACKPLPKNGLPLDISILTAKNFVEQAMSQNGLLITFDDAGNPLFKQKVSDIEIDYFVNNKKIDLDSYIDSVLTEKKFVQANDSTSTQQSNPNTANTNQRINHNPRNEEVLAEIDAKLSELGFTPA